MCWVRFGESATAQREQLTRAFPSASFEERRSGSVADWTRAIADYVDGKSNLAEVPLDVAGSRFEQRVWSALREIPRGSTRSYSEVARKLGSPDAARAVARAVTQNPAPVLIPCHRVVLKTGGLAGSPSGVAYQRAMLIREGAL